MNTFLTWATVIYALILVVVLAVSLIAIVYFLWSIGTTLEKISTGLAAVRQQTAPLSGHITVINDALTDVGAGLSAALDDLAETNQSLGTVLGDTTQAEKVA